MYDMSRIMMPNISNQIFIENMKSNRKQHETIAIKLYQLRYQIAQRELLSRKLVRYALSCIINESYCFLTIIDLDDNVLKSILLVGTFQYLQAM